MLQATEPPTEILTTKEAADLLRKPESWLYNNVESLGIPRYRIGKQFRFKRSKVLAWLEEQEER